MSAFSFRDRMFFIVLGCSFLFVLPLMLANTPYVDDIYRSQSGIIGWKGLGRPLAEVVMLLLNFNLTHYFIVDLSPLPLLISALVLSLSVMHIIKYFDVKWDLRSVLPFLFLIFNPFFIHNLAYKFDCFPMSLGVAAAVFAFAYPFSKNWRSLAIPGVLIFASLALYQPSANVYVSLVFLSILLGIASLSSLPQLLIQAMGKIGIFAAVYVAYYICFTIVGRFVKSSAGSSRSGLVSLDMSGFYDVCHNVRELLLLVRSLYDGRLLVIALVVLLLAISGLVLMACRYGEHLNSRRIIFPVACLLMVVLGAAFLSSIGPLLLLDKPFVMPRAMTGYSIFLVMVFTSVFYLLGRKYRWLSYTLIGLTLTYSFVCMAAFSNAIKLQYDFDSKAVMSIYEHLQADKSLLAVDRVMATGVSVEVQDVKNILRAFPYLRYMVAPMYDWTATVMLGGVGVPNAYFKFERDEYSRAFSRICADASVPAVDNNLYAIYSGFGYTVIYLKGDKHGMCIQ